MPVPLYLITLSSPLVTENLTQLKARTMMLLYYNYYDSFAIRNVTNVVKGIAA